jgi:hypothetical protein
VCLDEIEGRSEADEVIDADIEAWMKKSLGEVCKLTTTDDIEAWMKKSLGEVCKLTTTDDIAAMVQRKVRTNMQEKDSSMHIN